MPGPLGQVTDFHILRVDFERCFLKTPPLVALGGVWGGDRLPETAIMNSTGQRPNRFHTFQSFSLKPFCRGGFLGMFDPTASRSFLITQ